jgi:hypothetical protein
MESGRAIKKERGTILGRGVFSSQIFFWCREKFYATDPRLPLNKRIVTSEKNFNKKRGKSSGKQRVVRRVYWQENMQQ